MNTMKLLVASGLLALAGACTSGSNNNNSVPTPAPSNCTKADECAGLGSLAVAVPCCDQANYVLVTDPDGKCGTGGIVGQSTMKCVQCTHKDSCLPVVPGATCCTGLTATDDSTCTNPAGGGAVVGVQNKRCK